MNEHDLQRLVQAAVKAVLAELGGAAEAPAAGPLVRVLFGDSSQGRDYAVAALRRLGGEGLRLEHVVTTGGRSQANPGFLRELPGTLAAQTDEEAGCPLAFARGADLVVAATLDRPTAVRLAHTAAERFADRFLLEALSLGKPVVLATDGFELEAPAATPQLRAALAEPRARLETYGAVCVAAVDLREAVRQVLDGQVRPGGAVGRELITVVEVEAAEGTLVLAPDAIVTPLALDRARELGVTLRRVPR
ncbi:MAG: hypothetical protein HYU66_27085 [Armatimonadetes bacterium]|nr:hypothetical protein [Armatimonadota bacterium]